MHVNQYIKEIKGKQQQKKTTLRGKVHSQNTNLFANL